MKTTVRRALGLCLALPALAGAAPRDVLTLSLEELARLPVSAAAGYDQPQTEAPGAAFVIRAEQWEALGAHSVWDVLEHVPGLHVTEGLGNRQVIARGMLTTTNSQVLWLLDGLPVNDLALGGSMPAFDKGLAGLDRIEIIRGPVSVIHGSSAFSAVIHLVSRDAGRGSGRVGAGGGSHGSRQARAETGGARDDWRWRLSLERRESDGDPGRVVDRDLQSTFDALFGTRASLAPAPVPSRFDTREAQLRLAWRDTSLQLWHWENEAATRMGAGALDVSGQRHNRLTHLVLRQAGELPALATRWELEALYQRQHNDLTSVGLPPGTTVPIGANGSFDFLAGSPVTFTDGLVAVLNLRGERRQLAFNLLNTAWPGHTLRLGSGYEWQELREEDSRRNSGPGVIDGSQPVVGAGNLPNYAGTPLGFLPDVRRDIAFIALQDDWRLAETLLLNLGVRHDRYSDFGASTSPRATLQWQATPATRLRLGAGTAFRAPSFSEQYLRNNPAFLGTTTLRPETLRSGELGLEQALREDLQLTATLFRYEARRFIDFLPGATGTEAVATNVEGREGTGSLIELSWQPRPGARLNGWASVWEVKDTVSGDRAAFVPGHMLGASGWWEFAPRWTLGGTVKHVADRRREPGDPRPGLADDSWADLQVQTRAFSPRLRLGLAVQNVADADLRDPVRNTPGLGPTVPGDIPLEGRTWRLEAEYRWD